MTPDLANAAFEGVGALLTLLNLRALLRDRKVAGVRWEVTAFWSAWGAWNLYYYPALGQWFSFGAGCLLFASNMAWVVLALYFTRRGEA